MKGKTQTINNLLEPTETKELMLDELGIPITAFCRKVGISASYFYACKKGTLNFSKEVEERIHDYLTKYGF